MKKITISGSNLGNLIYYKNELEVDFWLDQQLAGMVWGDIDDYDLVVSDVVAGEVMVSSSAGWESKVLQCEDVSGFNTSVTNIVNTTTHSASDIHITFGGAGYKQNYWEFKKRSYYVGCRFYFAGTDVLGTPETIKVIAYMKGRYEGTVQLYDYTHRRVISEVSVRNIVVFEKVKEYIPQILTGPLLDEFPTSGVLLEVRAKSDGNNHKGYLNSLTICF